MQHGMQTSMAMHTHVQWQAAVHFPLPVIKKMEDESVCGMSHRHPGWRAGFSIPAESLFIALERGLKSFLRSFSDGESDKITKRCHSHHRASLEAGCCCRIPEKHYITPGLWSMGRSWADCVPAGPPAAASPLFQCTGNLYVNPDKASQLQANRNLPGAAGATDHEGCSLDLNDTV